MSEKIRLQVFLAHSGIASRRAAEKLIVQGRVSVNGTPQLTLGSSVDPEQDVVEVDGQVISFEEKVLFLFHKPRGIVSTLRDPHATRTLEEFLKRVPQRIYPIGRLDADVSGLLLLTNDGAFAESILHPRYEVERVYIARVRGLVDDQVLRRLQSGVRIDGGDSKSAQASRRDNSEFVSRMLGSCEEYESYIEVRVHEGAKHFVKKLLAAAERPVVQLSRISFGEFSLGDLPPGELLQVPFPHWKRLSLPGS